MTTATQLTEAELDRLETLLDDPNLGDAMRLDEIQGYLCAALAGPVQIPLEDRLQEILGEESAQDSDAAREAKELLVRFAAALEASLDSDDNFPLLLYPKDESEDAPSDFELWCLAYLHGVDSAVEDWFDSLSDEEEIDFLDENLFPLMVLTGEAEAAARQHGEEWPEGEELAALLRENEDALPYAVSAMHAFWRAKRGAVTVRNDAPKVGRNDPCPCGSGKKFKQCCGAAE